MPAPANDTRAAAEALTGDTGSGSGTTVEATGETGTVYEDQLDVWFEWADGEVPEGPFTVSLTPASHQLIEVSLWAEEAVAAAETLDNRLGANGFDDADPIPTHVLTVTHPGGPLTLAVAVETGDEVAFDFAWSATASSSTSATAVSATEQVADADPTGGATSAATASAPTEQAATALTAGRRWRAVVCDCFGTVISELPHAIIGDLTFEDGQPESWQVQLLQNDPAISPMLDERFREMQIWRGDTLHAFGPIVRTAYDRATMIAHCRGALWHLTRRNVGKPVPDNWVVNGDFELGAVPGQPPGSWSRITSNLNILLGLPEAQTELPDVQVVTAPTVTGSYAISMANFVPGCDAFLAQAFLFTVDPATSPAGDTFTLSGYCYLPEQIVEGNEAGEGRGLYLERSSTTELDPNLQGIDPGHTLSLQHEFVALDADVPAGEWQRFTIALTTPPKAGEPELINVRLYAPADQTVYWDNVKLTRDEHTGFYLVDQADIVAGLVEHAQDPDYEKSDVNLTHDCPATGVIRTRVYVHAEHPPIYPAVFEFTDLYDGMDVGCVYTPTSRVVTTYYPRRGAYKPALLLAVSTSDGTNETPGLVSDWAVTWDGEQAASVVGILGTGNGSDREMGVAVDTSEWSQGVTMERFQAAPNETPVDSLDDTAIKVLALSRRPETLEVKTHPYRDGLPDLIGAVGLGDVLPVQLERHDLSLSGDWRVVRYTISPTTGTMSITLVPEL